MKLFCPIRKRFISKTPEEEVRQALLSSMIDQLGYPASLLAVEKNLSTITQLPALPNRRVDILAFATHASGTLKPLMLIECKAGAWDQKVFLQLIGYNRFVNASWVAIACGDRIAAGYQKESWEFREGLPFYSEAVEIFKNISSP